MEVRLRIHFGAGSELEGAGVDSGFLDAESQLQGAAASGTMSFKDYYTFAQVLSRVLVAVLGHEDDLSKYRVLFEGQVVEPSVPMVTMNIPNDACIMIEPLSDEMFFLSNTEVVGMLQSLQQKRTPEELQLSNQQSLMMERTLNYCKKFDRLGNYATAVNIRNHREELWSKGKLDDFTISKLIDLSPEDAAEAKTLIPALASIPEDEIKSILDTLTSRNTY